MSYIVVPEYERIVVSSGGHIKAKNPRGPGIVFFWPCLDDIRTVDIRTMICSIPTQQILTKDAVTVMVDAVVFHKVVHPVKALTNVEDYRLSTSRLASSTLRNVLGMHTLDEILENREEISKSIQQGLLKQTENWGTRVERVAITDITLPESLQESMAAEAEASRKASARLIISEGEKKAALSLAEASRYMADESATIELRYMQTLADISSDNSSTIIFPFPVDVVQGLMNN